MDVISGIITWFTTNWAAIALTVWSIDQTLKLIVKLTPWNWDDNIADIIGSIIAKIFPKKS